MIIKATKIFLSDFGDIVPLTSAKITESVSRMFQAFASKVIDVTEDLPFFVSKGYVFPSVKYCVKSCKGEYSAVIDVEGKSCLFNLSASNETDALRQARSVIAEVFSGHVVAAFDFSDGSSVSAVSFGSGDPVYTEMILDGAFNSKAGVWTKIAQGMSTPNRTKFVENTLARFAKQDKAVIAVRAHKNLKAFKALASSMGRVVTHLNNAVKGEGTVGIFTAIQGMGKGSTVDSTKNEKNYAELGKILNTLQNGPIPMKGMWHGEAEDSYLVPNIPLDMLKALNARYKQWAFIYAGPDTKGQFQFWATSDPSAGPQSYEMVSTWDNYAVEGLKEPEGYTALPGTDHKFSFYEGGDTPQEYINAVDELNNWANTALDSVKVEFADADREGRISEKNAKLKEQVVASKVVKSVFGKRAYWISPSGEIILCPYTHIRAVIDDPEKYGLTKDEITQAYKKYGEPLGHEGKAREEIMVGIINKGWARVRWVPSKYSWTVQIADLNKRAMDNLQKWSMELATSEPDLKNSAVTILPISSGMTPSTHSLNDIASDVLFNSVEAQKRVRASKGERREDVGKYNTVEKVINAVGRTPSEQELAKFINDNYYDVTEVERGEDDEKADDKIADLVGYFKYDIDDWLAAWEGVTKKVEAAVEDAPVKEYHVVGSEDSISMPDINFEEVPEDDIYNFIKEIGTKGFFDISGKSVSYSWERSPGSEPDFSEQGDRADIYAVFDYPRAGMISVYDYTKEGNPLAVTLLPYDDTKIPEGFEKMMETDEFIYYGNPDEQDENGNTIITDKASGRILSDNIFASNSFFEDLLEGNFTWLSDLVKGNLDVILETYDESEISDKAREKFKELSVSVEASGNKEHHLWYMYIKGDIDLDSLIEKAGKVEEVASKKELEDFLKNKFMLSLMAEENAVSPDVITDKVTELLKRYPDASVEASAGEVKITEDDVASVWPLHLSYLTEILNEEYPLKNAQEDVRSLIGSKFDPRVKSSKKVKAVVASEMDGS